MSSRYVRGPLVYANTTVQTAAGNVTCVNESLVVVNKTSGQATTVTLPASPATGQTLQIKDGKGDAAVYPITVTPSSGTIEGWSSAYINRPYGSLTVCYNGTEWVILSEKEATDWVEVSDDFPYFVSTDLWTSVLTDSGTAAVSDAVGGVLTLTCSDGTVADNDEAYAKSTTEVFKFAASKPIRLEARVKLTEANTDDANILVGLLDAVGANSLLDNGGGPPASYSGMVFFKVDGGTVWQAETSIAGTQDTDTSAGAFTSATWHNLRIEWVPASDTSGTAKFYVDGVLGATSTFTYTGATEMQAVLGVKNGGANNESLLVDRFRARQLR